MPTRKLYDAEADLLRLETIYMEEEGTFDDNWIVSASDLFGEMMLPNPNDDSTPSTMQPFSPGTIHTHLWAA